MNLETFSPPVTKRFSRKRRALREWLLDLLGTGPVRVQTVREQAALNGLNWLAVVAMKQELRVTASNPSGSSHDWWWALDGGRADAV